jgi:hypothetical protein
VYILPPIRTLRRKLVIIRRAVFLLDILNIINESKNHFRRFVKIAIILQILKNSFISYKTLLKRKEYSYKISIIWMRQAFELISDERILLLRVLIIIEDIFPILIIVIILLLLSIFAVTT